jgi:hypothetical protein
MKKAMGLGDAGTWEYRDRDGAIFRLPAGQSGGATDVFNDGKWSLYTGNCSDAYLQSDLTTDPMGGNGGGGDGAEGDQRRRQARGSGQLPPLVTLPPGPVDTYLSQRTMAASVTMAR